MILNTRQWGSPSPESIVCIHGITQEGSIFEELGRRLEARGHSVVAVDLRGHGGSGTEPPWNTDTHVSDILATLDSLEVKRATWVGHSYGGRLAATLAASARERTAGLVLLDPALQIPADRALRSAELERLDWSFATVEGAVQAMLSSDSIVAAPRDVVTAFVKSNVKKGPDGRFRFNFSPSAVVVAWSEMTLPPPPIAPLRTLIVRAAVPLTDDMGSEDRYREKLGDLARLVYVPNGHNLLWESPQPTIEAIEKYLEVEGQPVP